MLMKRGLSDDDSSFSRFNEDIAHIIWSSWPTLYWPDSDYDAKGLENLWGNCKNCEIPRRKGHTRRCYKHPLPSEIVSSSECGDDCCYTITEVRRFPCCGSSYMWYGVSLTIVEMTLCLRDVPSVLMSSTKANFPLESTRPTRCYSCSVVHKQIPVGNVLYILLSVSRLLS